MGQKSWAAAVMAAALTVCATPGNAEDVQPFVATHLSAMSVETSARLRLNWTEIAFRGDRPKAWDEITSPELRASIRLQLGMFEGKLELGGVEDLFDRHPRSNTRTLRAELQAGVVFGDWAVLAEWKPRNVFAPGFDDFLVGLDSYDIKLRNRFALSLMPDLPRANVQATVAAGYVAALPDIFRRDFVEVEVEIVQRLSQDFALTIAPKLELSNYLNFPGGDDRQDAAFSVRIVPAANLGNGVTISVEGQALIAVSTRESKTGENWAVTPILRLQKSL